ncbi:MAG: hypothetical protein AYK22_03925 [Thermoplasmatales archaeon SG8-52-3]|nr:MAG: hypothetical protein AYK22_03925 [Thermoplasmatales archaeon SG8-52-3]
MKFTKKKGNIRLLIFTVFFMFFLSILLSFNVYAHSPSNMNLGYNITTKELEVSLNHQVSNTNSHYVNNIVVKINGETIINKDYTSQPESSFTYIYNNTQAEENDTIEVTAFCNQGGSITRQLKVSSGKISQTDDDSTPGFQLILFVISIIFLIFVFKIKKSS